MLHIFMNDFVQCCEILCCFVEIGHCVVRILRNDVRVVSHSKNGLLYCENYGSFHAKSAGMIALPLRFG